MPCKSGSSNVEVPPFAHVTGSGQVGKFGPTSKVSLNWAMWLGGHLVDAVRGFTCVGGHVSGYRLDRRSASALGSRFLNQRAIGNKVDENYDALPQGQKGCGDGWLDHVIQGTDILDGGLELRSS